MNGEIFSKIHTLKLIDSALKDNYDLQFAVKRIEEAEEYVKQAKMNYVPSLDEQASA